MSMERKVIVYILTVLLVITMGLNVNAAEQNIVDFNRGDQYSSYDYYNIAKILVDKYSEILHLEIIGRSIDKRPIYSL